MKKRILVVDDDEYIRDLYNEILSDAGYDVEIASDGADALDVLEKKSFDLVLLDIMMPKMDGIEMLKHLSGKKKEISVVLLTNLAHNPVLKEAKSLGAIDYLIKADLTPDQLVEKIKGYFG
ncbi:hypothetical protein A3D06_02145 [Candidatus Roizmanbacteria bacterium RIFCSPHIGHO2_02_FULL_40_9]|uniref:Response regulatory domain-containing protein n=1 Tax=Candidatus Roizmanbacteria bacterium RIFCSPHIGHO2_02_FULL_40_9 TaxID=1802042 RepID=A0A1F7HBE7_9BACT|nr:MAG: hypothetical protein A3D06_02145 [Candidatus Roizmanbacteria bacterium RIFCSPHIGHO2_02_FULL_40_9]